MTRKKMGRDLDDVATGSRADRRPRADERIDVHKFKDKAWTTIRLFGTVFCSAEYWIETKKKDGSKTRFPTSVPSFDYELQDRDSEAYDPWRDAAEELNVYDRENPKNHREVIQYSRYAWMNAIVRSLEKNAPRRPSPPTRQERKTGLKDKDSDSFTPVAAVRLSNSLLKKIQQLKGLNTYESKSGQTRSYAVSDEKYGRDIRVYYDKDAAPNDQYQVQLGERRKPLTDEEKEYLIQDLTLLADKVPSREELERDFNSWAQRNDMEVEEVATGKKKDEELLKKKKRRAVEDDDDFDDDDFDDEDDDFEDDDFDDEDEKPKSKSKSKKSKTKSKSKKSKKAVEDDDFDDDDFGDDDFEDDDFEDDEEEEKPKSKKSKSKTKAKPKSKSKKSKKPVEDDFDDEDDDFEDDDFDDEDEKPKSKKSKSKTKSKKSKKAVEDEDFDDEDDDFDDDDFDDEDDEEEEKPKSKKSKSKSKKAKKPVEDDDFDDEDDEDFDDEDDDFDDDDFEDDDFDDDEDDEEEEKPKTKRKKSTRKSRR